MAFTTTGILPSVIDGIFRSASFVPSANGCVTTAGGLCDAHFNSHPKISASICRSKTTGIPSGLYSSIDLLIPFITSSEDFKYVSASTPVKKPPCTPTNGTQGTRSTVSNANAFLINSNPFIM